VGFVGRSYLADMDWASSFPHLFVLNGGEFSLHKQSLEVPDKALIGFLVYDSFQRTFRNHIAQ
jgi:hypothetical protein